MSIPVESYLKRRHRARETASARGYDALLVVGRSPDRAGDLVYLAQHRPMMSGHTTRYTMRGRGYGALLLPVAHQEPALVVTTPFYDPPVAIERVYISSNFSEVVARMLVEYGLHTAVIGLVGMDILSVTLFEDLRRLVPGVQWVPADDVIQFMRAVKTPEEIAIMEEGARIGDLAAQKIHESLRPGMTELEAAEIIKAELARHGVVNPFATCQSGVERSGEPYMIPPASSRVLEPGDMVHMEINGYYGGYMIDICRSTVVGGPNPRQKMLLELAVEMLQAAVEATRPGVLAEDLERITSGLARKYGLEKHHTIATGGPGTYLGHGIGVGSDEPPILAAGDRTILQPGMVLTIEPGIYRTDVGGLRIEDEVLVTESGARVLNRYTRVWW